MQRAILFFVKHPSPGKVKTRLAATLGAREAANIYRRLVTATCSRLHGETPVIVAFDPADRGAEIEQWLRPLLPPTVSFIPQIAGDLGTRLADAFRRAFAQGATEVLVVGSDCFELDSLLLASAWESLAAHDCVLGPTPDGGYYLLGVKSPSPLLFTEIRWSSPHTLADTLERARAAGLTVYLLPERADVDTDIDWQRAQPHLHS